MKKKGGLDQIILTLPSYAWLVLFFLIPTLIIFAFALKPSDMYGGIGQGWTLANFKNLIDPAYFHIFLRTLWLGVLTTIISLLLALPVGYQIARSPKKRQKILLLLIVLPFWSSFLIRIFAWKSLLHPEGLLKYILVSLSIISSETSLLYNSGAVILVMVYTYFPFGVLPIYAASSKFNFQLCEAAMDLGATRWQAFCKVFLPGIKAGIYTASLMIFIPALGAYVIPDLVGGSQSEMIGNKIAQRTFVDRNLPMASALSVMLALGVLLPMALINWIQSRTKRLTSDMRGKE